MKVDRAERLKHLELANAKLKRLLVHLSLDKVVSKEIVKETLSSERQRCAVIQAGKAYGLSERRACPMVQQERSTQHHQPTQRDEEDELTRTIVILASHHRPYSYRRITALSKTRLERRQGHGGVALASSGLKIPLRQKR